jgi:glycopeptide antibiotics resistance protein
VFASVMEYIQFFTFWRAFNINDLVANILGVVCGYLLLLLVKKKGSRQ